jgi:hypothetical protein
LNVELFDFNNNVTYYLKRTYSGTTPSTPVWTTTQSGSGYEILVGTFQEFSGQVTLGNSDVIQIGGPTTIVTPKIPSDGDMTINWDFVGFVNTNGSVRGLNIGNSSSYKMTLQSVDTSNSVQYKIKQQGFAPYHQTPTSMVCFLMNYPTQIFSRVKANAAHWSINMMLVDCCLKFHIQIGAKGIRVLMLKSKNWFVKNC